MKKSELIDALIKMKLTDDEASEIVNYISENYNVQGKNDVDRVSIKKCMFVDRDCVENQCRAWGDTECILIQVNTRLNPVAETKSRIAADGIKLEGDLPADGFDLKEVIRIMEKTLIQKTLEKFGKSKSKAATYLNITYDSLHYKMEVLGLSDE